jgi:endo-1,4-beta-xylanase
MPHWSRRRILRSTLAGAGAAALPWSTHAEPAVSPSLDSLARAKGMRFGSSLGGRGLADAKYVELVTSQCGMIVPENELKMPFVQRTPGEFTFERAEKLLAFAHDRNLAVRGHCLLWHHPRWVPRWLETYDFGTEPAKSAETLLVTHIERTCTQFGKRIVSWDVVNEAVDNITGEMRETAFSKALGSPDAVIDRCFRAARAVLPGTELVYNDYMGWEDTNGPHRDGVLRLLERLRRKGTPVNALGIQAHIGCGNQDSNANRSFDARDEKAWRKFLREVTGMGYSLLVTEFDVHDATLPADFAQRDREVAALGRAFLDITLDFRQVNAVLVWGLADNHTWLQGRTPRTDRLPKRPTPYDNTYQPKPLRDAIAAAFRAAPNRRSEKVAGIPA